MIAIGAPCHVPEQVYLSLHQACPCPEEEVSLSCRCGAPVAAQSLQDQGLISYRRGMIQLQDRTGLEAVACECYSVVKMRFDAFLTPPSSAVQEAESGRTDIL